MSAIDTVLYDVHNTTAGVIGLTAATVTNSGDAPGVRYFSPPAQGFLEAVGMQSSGARSMRIASPLLHDNVTGLTFNTSEQPSSFLLPQEVGQPLQPGDVLNVFLDAAATSDSLGILFNYYTQLPGVSARLFNWGDISSIIKSIKTVEVDVTTAATIGAWSDTLITTTEQQLHAGTDYAVLGYETQTALAVVAIKGQDTGNLRVGGPGVVTAFDTSDYFVQMSSLHGRPHIPVFSADNRFATYVSTAANTASVAAKTTLVLAELTQRLPVQN